MENNEAAELVDRYRQKLEEQTHLIFALVGKMGGEVELTVDDFNAFPDKNTVNAEIEDNGTLVLKLDLYEE